LLFDSGEIFAKGCSIQHQNDLIGSGSSVPIVGTGMSILIGDVIARAAWNALSHGRPSLAGI
jgi:hypothetical protein